MVYLPPYLPPTPRPLDPTPRVVQNAADLAMTNHQITLREAAIDGKSLFSFYFNYGIFQFFYVRIIKGCL